MKRQKSYAPHQDTPVQRPDRLATWRRVNISLAERVGRVIVGLAAIIAGTMLLASAGPTIAVVLEVLLVAAGLDLLVTGTFGHCPLYQKLGHTPKSLRRPG